MYVFCGIENKTKRYINSIEFLDIALISDNLVTKWDRYDIDAEGSNYCSLTARQGLGVCQIDADGILICGGYTGKFTNDSFYLNIGTRRMVKTDKQLPVEIFPFAVPTLGDVSTNSGYSVDWQKFKMYRFKDNAWSMVASFKGN